MEIIFSPTALSDLEYWKKTGNTAILKKIRHLIEAIETDPYNGIGKPEKLKYNWSHCWSRRITREHRFIYELSADGLIVHSLRHHYQ